jgi:hypothetical protein
MYGPATYPVPQRTDWVRPPQDATEFLRVRAAISAARRDLTPEVAALVVDHLGWHIAAGWCLEPGGATARLVDELLRPPARQVAS